MVNLMSQPVLSFLMLSGTDSWRIDRYSLAISALCKGSCNHNELQSGLFVTILIFHANIWDKQAFWRTQRYDNPHFSHSLCDPFFWWIATIMPMSLMLLNVISTSVHLYLSWPASSPFFKNLFCFYLLWRHPSFSFYLFISLQHRVQRWRTLSNRLMLASSTTQVIRLSYFLYSLSLPPSVALPLPSPYFGLSHQKEPWQVDMARWLANFLRD